MERKWRIINRAGNFLSSQVASQAVSIQMSSSSMHMIIKYSSDLRGFLIFAAVFEPSGTKLSISLEYPSTEGSSYTVDGTLPEIEPDSFIGPWWSIEESVLPILLGTEASKEEEGVVASKYPDSPSVDMESFSVETPSSDVWLFRGLPFLPPLTLYQLWGCENNQEEKERSMTTNSTNWKYLDLQIIHHNLTHFIYHNKFPKNNTCSKISHLII